MFNNFYKDLLSPSEKDVYNKMLEGFKKLSTSVKIYSQNELDINKVFQYVLMDNVDIYYIYQFKYTYNYETKMYCIMPIYTIDSYLKDQYDKNIKEMKLKIWREVKSMNKWEAVLKLHDYICVNVKYTDFGDNAHTLLGPLLQGRGVCDGISKMFKYLCNEIFVQSLYVTGKAIGGINNKEEGHAWNKVNLNNEWYQMDVTFDIGSSDNKTCSHRYFMVPDKLLKSTHKEDYPSNEILCLSDELSYFHKKNIEVNSVKETVNLIKNHILNNEYVFEIYFKYVKNSELIDTISKCMNKACNELNKNLSYVINYTNDSNTVTIKCEK